jgi:RHS repeat-associated protein
VPAATSERYYAYGKDRGTGNLPTDHRFTGQISDASGLIFMNARYYDPVLGSFLSPDTVVPEPGLPETLLAPGSVSLLPPANPSGPW